MMRIYPWGMSFPKDSGIYANGTSLLEDAANVSEKVRAVFKTRYTATPFTRHAQGLTLRVVVEEER